MVTHRNFPGFAVTICGSDGQPFQEFDNSSYRPSLEESQSSVAAKYIMSEAGKIFSIKISLQPELEMTGQGIYVDLLIDGKRVRGRFFRKSIFEERGKNVECVVKGVGEGIAEKAFIRPFKFTNLRTSNFPRLAHFLIFTYANKFS